MPRLAALLLAQALSSCSLVTAFPSRQVDRELAHSQLAPRATADAAFPHGPTLGSLALGAAAGLFDVGGAYAGAAWIPLMRCSDYRPLPTLELSVAGRIVDQGIFFADAGGGGSLGLDALRSVKNSGPLGGTLVKCPSLGLTGYARGGYRLTSTVDVFLLGRTEYRSFNAGLGTRIRSGALALEVVATLPVVGRETGSPVLQLSLAWIVPFREDRWHHQDELEHARRELPVLDTPLRAAR